ncbi:hypothetical protein M501DRAFT_1001473 [Patellaria atrata CBS 101060]|uniref:HECT-type E3 ubiquitin transferase n=1 Tax=Patellaria atrata CBS 101060 TaxID=1346257 RepID=A0A9P4VK73_9PEZI|nr:hypothetical protein M501DRAFT_1001473 [Patellaria atrata CBS 101060]
MGKIKKTATSRHEATLSPALAEFIQFALEIPLHQLPSHLSSFPRRWPFPRGDMYHWIPVLNRFDHILELFNIEYGLNSGPQAQPFSRKLLQKGDGDHNGTGSNEFVSLDILMKLGFQEEGDRDLVESILSFTKILYENCGNRSLYSSSSHLNDLLNTTSLSLLNATLRLTLRLAQRYHGQRNRMTTTHVPSILLANHYNINLDNVQKLASPFSKASVVNPSGATPLGKGKDKVTHMSAGGLQDPIRPTDLVSLVKEKVYPDTVWADFGNVQLSYYESTLADSTIGSGSQTGPDNFFPTTPTPVRRTSNLSPHQLSRQGRSSLNESPNTPPSATAKGSDNARSAGPKSLEITPEMILSTPVYELVASYISQVPTTSRYELLHRIRSAQALTSGAPTREDLVSIRLLAISNLAYIYGEETFRTKILQQDSEEPRRFQLAYQLAELVHPPGNSNSTVSRNVQALALTTLDALLKHKSRMLDVCAALSVNVNHGVLFYVLRKAVAELENDNENAGDHADINNKDDWREALFSLLNSLPNSPQRTGEAMISAGLIDILIEILKFRTSKAEQTYPKVLNFLDLHIFNIKDAFQSLVNAKGLDIVADLTAFEVETSHSRAQASQGMPDEYKTQLTDYQIPYHQQQTLRWLFKFMIHMMSHSGGNFDRLLRNLIDSPQLLKALRIVLSNARIFGSNVWSSSVAILSNFIHNEPTSYAVIAEAGLSTAFLEAVTQKSISNMEESTSEQNMSLDTNDGEMRSAGEAATVSYDQQPSDSDPGSSRDLARGILPNGETMSVIPQAFGAICLNTAGMRLFKDSGALASFFEIFESPDHVKILEQELDGPNALGGSFDELVRHHPELKSSILRAVRTMIQRVGSLCFSKAINQGVGAKLWYQKSDGIVCVAGGRSSLSGLEGPIHKEKRLQMESSEKYDPKDVTMQDADSSTLSNPLIESQVIIDEVVETESAEGSPTTVQYINVVCRFLGGFFSNNLCSSFIEAGGLEDLLGYASLPCLPYDFQDQVNGPGDEISRVISMLVEQKPQLALPLIIKRAQNALDHLDSVFNHNEESAFFSMFTNGVNYDQLNESARRIVDKGTTFVKALVTVHTLCQALAHTFQHQAFTHRSHQNLFTQVNLADLYARLIESLGQLQRRCVWEEILLQRSMSPNWESATRIRRPFGFGTEEADNVLGISLSAADETDPLGSENTQPSSGGNSSTAMQPSATSDVDKSSAQFKNTRTLRYLLSQVPTTITPFFQALGKLLLLRRTGDSYQKQNATIVAEQLSRVVLDHLRFLIAKNAASDRDRYAYLIVTLSSISQVMIDSMFPLKNEFVKSPLIRTELSGERGYSQPVSLLTLVLQAFKTQGGLEVLSEILETFFQKAEALNSQDDNQQPEADKEGLTNLAFGGIKIILSFYSQIISSKVVNESTQTQAMQSRTNQERDRSEVFIPAQFLVELRMAVITPVQKLWESPLMDKATTSIVKTTIEILRTVLESDTEQGAYRSSDKVPQRSKPTWRTWKLRNQGDLQKLKDEGYPEDLAREALYRCSDTLNTARDYCVAYKREPGLPRNPIPENMLPMQSRLNDSSPNNVRTAQPPVTDDALGADETTSSQTRDLQPSDEQAPSTDDASTDDFVPPIPLISNNGDALTMLLNTGSFLDRQAVPIAENGTEASKLSDVITVDDLDAQRSQIRSNLIERALDVLNVHDNVTFELTDLITAAVSKASDSASMRSDIGETLVQSLISLQVDEDTNPDSKKISSYAHLLALIIQNKPFYEAALEQLKDSFGSLISFIRVTSSDKPETSSPWIGHVLLIVERLLAEDVQPQQIHWIPPPTNEVLLEDTSAIDVPESVISQEEKLQLFDAVVEVLPRIGKDASLALSIVRVLVILTRNRQISSRFGEKRNIQRLFLMIKQLAGSTTERLQSSFMLILRHIVEDDDTLRHIMRTEVQIMFEQQQRRSIDTSSYIRQMYHLVLRSPDIFVEVTNEKLEIPRYDPNQRPQTLALKKKDTEIDDSNLQQRVESADGTGVISTGNEADEAKPSTEQKTEQEDKPKHGDLKHPVVENPDGVIHYLLCELLAYKDVEDKEQLDQTPSNTSNNVDIEMTNADNVSVPPSESDSTSEQKKTERSDFKADQHPIYIYRCFILQCLTELLSSYNRTKVEFINFSRKADPQATTPSKPRSGVLNYLLTSLLPVGSLNHDGDLSFKKKLATSGWATAVVVALTDKTSEHKSDVSETINNEGDPELFYVRKFVLEHALKAFKDANSSTEPLDMKYSRLLTLADLFTKALMGKLNPNDTSPHSHEVYYTSQKQLAKIMYEKNFIGALTNSIADIDLNFPNSKRAVKYILRPLKALTQTAIELSVSSDSSTVPGLTTDGDEISTASSVSDFNEGREETPDLFRNSTLGLLDPGRNEESDSETSDDDDDEDMYGDEYGEEMDYEEDDVHADEDVVSDEDEEIEGMGPIEGLSGDVGMDVEVVMEDDEDLSDQDDDEEGDMSDEDVDEDDEDASADIELLDRIPGEEDGDSLDDGNEEDWADEDDEDFISQDNIEDGAGLPGHQHIDEIMEVLGDNTPRGLLAQLEGGNLDMALDREVYLEDEMPDEEEDEEDEEDYDGDDLVFEGGYEEDDDDIHHGMWGLDPDMNPNNLRGGHHHHHHHDRHNPWSMFPPTGRHIGGRFRPTGPTGPTTRGVDDGTNPLLQRSGRHPSTPLSGRLEAMSDWVHAIDPRLFGGARGHGPVSIIGDLINQVERSGGIHALFGHHGNGALHISIGNLPMAGFPPLESLRREFRRANDLPTHASRGHPSQSVAFIPASTNSRWQEEARLLFGTNHLEKSQRVTNSVLRLLVPPSIEAFKQREVERQERNRKAKEEAEAAAAKEKAEKEEREAKEKREREEREAAEEAARARERQEGISVSDVEPTEGQQMEGVESTQNVATEETNEAGPSESTPRITTTLRGRELDITGMGIDLEYLEALPEELREEVLMAQVSEQRSQAAAAGQEPTDISREFLEALPPDIREELLQQEAHDRRRREREEARRRQAANGNAPPPQAEDMDPASFLASLDPHLRQAVLLEQDDDILQHLPEDIVLEARQLGRDRRLNQFMDVSRAGRNRGIDRNDDSNESGEKKKPRPVIQMLDKAGVATLLRLLFVPQQGSAQKSLQGILKDVCENRQNRAEVISILLSILQDGSADINAVERSFAQLSLRAKHPAAQKTPQPLKRTQTGQLSTSSEMSPIMVVQQCLSMLSHLTYSNSTHIPSFFLTEHETGVGFKSRSSRKGKGKESKASRYPINALLNLLDRKLIIENSSVMEQLVSLLQNITQPLNMLLKKDKEPSPEGEREARSSQDAGTDTQPSVTEAEANATSSSTAIPAPTDITEGLDAIVNTEPTNFESKGEAGSQPREEEKSKKTRMLIPPEVPENNLCLVVNILAARECSSKTFRDTLSMINNMSALPDAKEVFGKELIKQAQELGHSILTDLAELVTQISQAKSGTDVQGMALTKFSPASSDQAKLLRVLTALDYLFDPKRVDTKDKPSSTRAEAIPSDQKADMLTALYENSTFGPLWSKLSECLSAIRQRGNMFNVATILLPLIEALMVVCKNTTLKDMPLSKTLHSQKEFALTSPPPESRMENMFFSFTEEHRKILNDLVRHNPKLMSGSFSLLVKNSKVLEFDNKRNYFNRKLHSRTEVRQAHVPLQLSVRRDQVFSDSYKHLYFKSGDEIKYGKLSIRFQGEEGVDAGGVTREWFQVLARQMFNPDYALFNPVASDRTTFHPNPFSWINPEHHLKSFEFIGRIIGKALYEGRVLDCHFSRAVYKRILGKPVSIKDMETLDLDYYKSLLWMLENDITDLIVETFSIEADAFGETKVIDLIENGRNIPVTEENKQEYVRLVVEYKLTGSVKEQLEHFLKGFHDIVPAELVAIFNEQELELLISGLPDIDVDDWKNNTEYHNYTAASPQIQWFWRAVRSFDKEERAKLLQFVTGTSKVPLNGFKELEGMNGFSRFNIHRDYGNKDRLPSSHTCFNQLDLPEYDSYETLRQQLLIAITAGSEYFGFA